MGGGGEGWGEGGEGWGLRDLVGEIGEWVDNLPAFVFFYSKKKFLSEV